MSTQGHHTQAPSTGDATRASLPVSSQEHDAPRGQQGLTGGQPSGVRSEGKRQGERPVQTIRSMLDVDEPGTTTESQRSSRQQPSAAPQQTSGQQQTFEPGHSLGHQQKSGQYQPSATQNVESMMENLDINEPAAVPSQSRSSGQHQRHGLDQTQSGSDQQHGSRRFNTGIYFHRTTSRAAWHWTRQ
jgi:hypothetical protein